eukprot:755138-Hanusia_phi.AAC.8
MVMVAAVGGGNGGGVGAHLGSSSCSQLQQTTLFAKLRHATNFLLTSHLSAQAQDLLGKVPVPWVSTSLRESASLADLDHFRQRSQTGHLLSGRQESRRRGRWKRRWRNVTGTSFFSGSNTSNTLLPFVLLTSNSGPASGGGPRDKENEQEDEKGDETEGEEEEERTITTRSKPQSSKTDGATALGYDRLSFDVASQGDDPDPRGGGLVPAELHVPEDRGSQLDVLLKARCEAPDLGAPGTGVVEVQDEARGGRKVEQEKRGWRERAGGRRKGRRERQGEKQALEKAVDVSSAREVVLAEEEEDRPILQLWASDLRASESTESETCCLTSFLQSSSESLSGTSPAATLTNSDHPHPLFILKIYTQHHPPTNANINLDKNDDFLGQETSTAMNPSGPPWPGGSSEGGRWRRSAEQRTAA